MYKSEIISEIKKAGLVAVIRAGDVTEAIRLTEACIAGGVTAAERAFTVPVAHKGIEELAKRDSGGEILIGAGTVLDSETARIAMLSGAQYIVSPCVKVDVIKICNRYQAPCFPGVGTITEAVTAMEAGAEILKLFPGELIGINGMKAFKGPLPQAQFMPTGGVSIDNAADWIKAGAVAVGAAGSLLKGDITANAKEFLKRIKEARGE